MKGDYHVWVKQLIRYAYFNVDIDREHHSERNEGYKQRSWASDGLRCRHYRSRVILRDLSAVGTAFMARSAHRQVEG